MVSITIQCVQFKMHLFRININNVSISTVVCIYCAFHSKRLQFNMKFAFSIQSLCCLEHNMVGCYVNSIEFLESRSISKIKLKKCNKNQIPYYLFLKLFFCLYFQLFMTFHIFFCVAFISLVANFNK